MKALILSILILFTSLISRAQTLEFFDDFESGTTTQWVLEGNWGITTNGFASVYGLSESPNGNYLNMEETSATMADGVDLTLAIDAYVEFAATYEIEYAFDYLHLEASHNNGQTWTPIYSFTGDSMWWRYSFSIGGFVGFDNVKVRMRFKSDQALIYDGFSVDNFAIVSYLSDVTPPMILHQGPEHYEGSLENYYALAEILDVSGVAFANLHYWVDTVYQGFVSGNNFNTTHWLFTIPPQDPGTWVDYYFIAGDSASPSNIDTTKLYHYIAGNTIKYDNGNVHFVQQIGQLSNINSAAVRISLNGLTDIVTGLIRTYTDPFIVNNDLEFHIWADNNGVPGSDLITPFIVTPEANADSPHKMTRIDLRPYADSLSDISGDVFIGYTSPNGWVYTPQTSPGIGGRTYLKLGTTWTLGNADYHFRVVTTAITGAPEAGFSYAAQDDPLIVFSDASQGNPTQWNWDFNDNGAFSLNENPSYVFSNNGTYWVCLTVNNGIASDTHCHLLTIDNCLPPIAGFEIDYSYSPEILFADTSLNYPSSWFWTLGENGNTWSFLNPTYTYTSNDTFTVCLHVSNAIGSDSICQEIIIDTYTAPEVSFSFNPANSPLVQFSDESSNLFNNAPSYWEWDFGNGSGVSNLQNPSFIFPNNGSYLVCLTAGNAYGENTWCNNVPILGYVPPIADFSVDTGLAPTLVFIDMSSNQLQNAATSWFWDFGDGTSSQLQNPDHFFAENGNYLVCLVASNTEGSDTVCYEITIQSYAIPQALFTSNSNNEPSIAFFDISTGTPTQWQWSFDDNGQTSINENPVYTFSTNDQFNVCLTVSNYLGSDSYCELISITAYLAAIASFEYQFLSDTSIEFSDLSTGNPFAWNWDFGYQGEGSFLQNPGFIYPEEGIYEVCLTVENNLGWSNPYCESIIIQLVGINQADQKLHPTLYPNPAGEFSSVLLYPQHQFKQLDLFNANGKLIDSFSISSTTEITIQTSNLPAGIYFLKLKAIDHYEVLKLIKL